MKHLIHTWRNSATCQFIQLTTLPSCGFKGYRALKNSSCVLRYVPEPGVGRERTSASLSHGRGAQSGSAWQTHASHDGSSQRADAAGPAPLQRSQHHSAPATAATQPEAFQREIPEEAPKLPGPRHAVASAGSPAPWCPTSSATATPTPTPAGSRRLQPGQNGPHGALDPAAGRSHRHQGEGPREGAQQRPREVASRSEHEGRPHLTGERRICIFCFGWKTHSMDWNLNLIARLRSGDGSSAWSDHWRGSYGSSAQWLEPSARWATTQGQTTKWLNFNKRI